MVTVIFDDQFQRTIAKIKDQVFQNSVKNKIKRIIENPEIGKPLRNVRKGTRELYVGGGSLRLAYACYPERDTVEFLDIYHKDEQ